MAVSAWKKDCVAWTFQGYLGMSVTISGGLACLKQFTNVVENSKIHLLWMEDLQMRFKVVVQQKKQQSIRKIENSILNYSRLPRSVCIEGRSSRDNAERKGGGERCAGSANDEELDWLSRREATLTASAVSVSLSPHLIMLSASNLLHNIPLILPPVAGLRNFITFF